MPEFSYIAKEKSGRSVKGLLSGIDEQEVLRNLSSQGLFPVEVRAAVEKRGLSNIGGSKVSSAQLSRFYSQLSDLLSSGVPLLRALLLMEEQSSNARLKKILTDIREQVSDGNHLAEALRRHPKTFPDFALSLIEAGEEGSFVEDALHRLAEFTEHQDDMRAKVLGSMIYPIFLLVFGSLVVSVMLVYFVPQFQPIFDRMEASGGLHWTTNTLMFISDFMQAYWLGVGLLIVALIYAFQKFRSSERGRRLVDQVLIYEVKIGNNIVGPGLIFRRLAIARFTRVLGTLLLNGVPMLRSLQISKNATGNIILSDAVAVASEQMSTGKSLAGPLRRSKQFPPDVVEMISVGEESNTLERVLVDIATRMEKRTTQQLDIFVRMLEPLMLLLLAGVVLFIVLALLLPILRSSNMV